jgi:hypothetical protein
MSPKLKNITAIKFIKAFTNDHHFEQAGFIKLIKKED